MFEKINKPPEYFKVLKSHPGFSSWREEVADGKTHPMEIENIDYSRMVIGRLHVDGGMSYVNQVGIDLTAEEELAQYEKELFADFCQQPKVRWAVDNSFDGLYIKKDPDHANFRNVYTFSVFLERKHITFWRLKFSGTNDNS